MIKISNIFQYTECSSVYNSLVLQSLNGPCIMLDLILDDSECFFDDDFDQYYLLERYYNNKYEDKGPVSFKYYDRH
jgi:hypothetical protein